MLSLSALVFLEKTDMNRSSETLFHCFHPKKSGCDQPHAGGVNNSLKEMMTEESRDSLYLGIGSSEPHRSVIVFFFAGKQSKALRVVFVTLGLVYSYQPQMCEL